MLKEELLVEWESFIFNDFYCINEILNQIPPAFALFLGQLLKSALLEVYAVVSLNVLPLFV